MKKFISKKIISMFSLAVLSFVLVGCFQPKTPEQIIAESKNPSLAKSYLAIRDLPHRYVEFNEDFIRVQDYISSIKGSIDDSVRSAQGAYLGNFDSSDDDIAKTFINNAKANGNSVKMYKRDVNAIMSSSLPKTWKLANLDSAYNLDNAFIEYDKDGRMVAVLARMHYYGKSLGYSNTRISFVGFKYWARQVENQVGNAYLTNGFITEFK